MKIPVALLFAGTLAVAEAFTQGQNAFVRQQTNLQMAAPAEFVKTEIGAHDVSCLLQQMIVCLF